MFKFPTVKYIKLIISKHLYHCFTYCNTKFALHLDQQFTESTHVTLQYTLAFN